jgi:hypothetical protein
MRGTARVSPLTLLFMLVAAGCATTPPPPVPVTGAPADLGGLVGEWSGDYWSPTTGRRGTIRFALEAETGAARGEVWMFPADRVAAGGESAAGRDHVSAAALQIRFVRVGPEGAISGTVEPYRDPECDCMVSTTFTGELDGDRREGTYTTRGGLTHSATGGSWEARRAASPP